MMQPIIRVAQLGKEYRVGARRLPYATLRESLTQALSSPLRWLRPRPRKLENTFWALKDLNFEIRPGEVVGIIGRNGAGKSTLLKVLSRITEPTTGQVDLFGRVASLLEVGTGFHPELTGRENVYLNGAILGMTRRETHRNLDRIVSFAEIPEFLDTPVKHYSSGMYMRLAFAVAAHLDPEILVIDEVLAVGDAAFQKKCLGKIGDVTKQGRTILFVSHNMVAVQAICTRALVMDHGQVRYDGETNAAVQAYLKAETQIRGGQNCEQKELAPGNDKVRLHSAQVIPEVAVPVEALTVSDAFRLRFEYWNCNPGAHLNLSMAVYNESDVCVFVSTTLEEKTWHGQPFPNALFRSECVVPGNFLNAGTYRVTLIVVEDCTIPVYQYDQVLMFEVLDRVEDRGGWYGKWIGVTRPQLAWTTDLMETQS